MAKTKRNIFKSLSIIFITIFLILGCSSLRYLNFFDECKNWKVTYEFRIDDSNSSVYKNLAIENKNPEDKIEFINYRLYKDGDETQNAIGIPFNNYKYIKKSRNIGAPPIEETNYIIKIDWNNKKETILLKDIN